MGPNETDLCCGMEFYESWIDLPPKEKNGIEIRVNIHGMEKYMSQVTTVYDASQHCKTTKVPQNLNVEMDCPYTGKSEKF